MKIVGLVTSRNVYRVRVIPFACSKMQTITKSERIRMHIVHTSWFLHALYVSAHTHNIRASWSAKLGFVVLGLNGYPNGYLLGMPTTVPIEIDVSVAIALPYHITKLSSWHRHDQSSMGQG